MRSLSQFSSTVLSVIALGTITGADIVGAQSAVLPGVDAELNCDVPLAASFDTVFDQDLFTFGVSAGEIVTISTNYTPDVITPNPYWRLQIGGMDASSCGSVTASTQVDCGPFLTAPATVVLEVEEFLQNETGDYAVHLQRLPFATACDQIPLTEGVVVDATIDHFLDSDLFSFCVSEGATVRVTVTEPAMGPPDPYWRLINGLGGPAADCDSYSLDTQDDCGLLSEADNPHRLQVKDFLINETGDYMVEVEAVGGDLIACPTSPHILIFEDGFESSDTSAWSTTLN